MPISIILAVNGVALGLAFGWCLYGIIEDWHGGAVFGLLLTMANAFSLGINLMRGFQ